MQAANRFIQVKVEDKGGFKVIDSSLLEGKIVSLGGLVNTPSENASSCQVFKKGDTVLFPATHGKVMEHSIAGVKYYFIDKDIILAYE